MAERLTVRGTCALVAAVLVAATSLPLRAQIAPPPATQAPTPPAGPPPDVYTIGRDRVTAPKVASEVKPAYTPEAMRARIQGVVRLRGIVERDGTISSVEVLDSLDRTYGLDQAAVNALQQGEIDLIEVAVRHALSPRHVPNDVFQVAAIPRTLSGKKMELPVKKLLMGADPASVLKRDAMANADSVDWFIGLARERAQRG